MATIGIWKINPYIGGTEVSLIELARFLSLSGHGVYVYGADKGIKPIATELGISISPEEDIWKHKHDVLLWYDDWGYKAKDTMSKELVEYMKAIPHRYGVFGGFADWLISPVFDKAIAKTQEIAQWLKQHRVKTEKVTQFPIDLNYWKRDNAWLRQTPVIGYVGRTEGKNIGQLVSLASAVGGNKVKLVVADRVDDEGVAGMGCEVIRNPKLVKPHYMDMDIFMMTSLKEGIPRVIMEAMAMSLPVVTFGIGGIPSLDPKYHLPTGSLPAMRERLRMLVQSQEERDKAGLANRKRIEEYDRQIRADLTTWFNGMGA